MMFMNCLLALAALALSSSGRTGLRLRSQQRGMPCLALCMNGWKVGGSWRKQTNPNLLAKDASLLIRSQDISLPF